MFIIITGNPVDGFKYYGPFEDNEDAIKAAEGAELDLDGDWWIAPISEVAYLNE